MSYKKEPIIKEIADNLAFSSKSTALKNVIGLFDSNRIAQDFFSELFKLIYGYGGLKDLDKLNDISNYPAIDLGDEDSRVAFQITTDASSDKIKDTIKKFIKYELYNTYDRLIIFIIGEKKAYTTSFDTQSKFSFDAEKDIWDDNSLTKDLDDLHINVLEEVQSFLKENLLEFKFPERFFPSDIEKCIKILKRDFGCSSALEASLYASRRGDDFIKTIKNPANNLSWEFFKEKIRGHLQYNKEILEFLSNPINNQIQRDYLEVAKAIQDFYELSSNGFTSFEAVFSEIFKKLNTYEDDIPGIDIKLKILLHNMYFNCDIGHNPISND